MSGILISSKLSQSGICLDINTITLRVPISLSTHHAVIRTTLSSKRHWLFAHAFIHNTVREHGLFRDAENERTKAVVIVWLALFPHTSQTMSISLVYSQQKKGLENICLPSMTLLTFTIASTTPSNPALNAFLSPSPHADSALTAP